jgi:hypothetical protein
VALFVRLDEELKVPPRLKIASRNGERIAPLYGAPRAEGGEALTVGLAGCDRRDLSVACR